jgi:hypothetical protein
MPANLCSQVGANTGEVLCDKSRSITKKLFIFNGSVLAAGYVDSDTFLAGLATKSRLSKFATEKIFPLPEVQEIADTSEANTEGTMGLGFKTVLREGKPSYSYKFFAGASLLKQLRKFNNSTVRVMEYDTNGNMWFTTSGSTILGYRAKLFFTGGKAATGAAVEEGVVTLTLSILDTTEYLDNAKFMPIEGNINDIEGLLDVDLSEPTAHVSNAHKIKVQADTSQANLKIDFYDDYSTLLASASLWEAFTGATFSTPLTITSVAADAANKAFTVTFDNTAYTALSAGAKIKLNLKAPDVLAAADVTGIEGIAVTLTK